MSSAEIINNTNISLPEFKPRDINRRFFQTIEGEKLAKKTRFCQFQGDLKNESWQKILGYDVNNLDHSRLVHGTTKLFIKHMNTNSEFFSPEEKKLLLLTSIIHDYPEGFTKKGDVKFDIKTDSDEKEELAFIDSIVPQAFGPKNQELSQEIKNILGDKESKLGNAFNSIEVLGYLRTALIAWKKSKILTEPTASNLSWLTYDVFSNSIFRLINYSSKYPPIYSFLKNKAPQISDAFDNLPNTISDKYQPEDRQEYITKFSRSLNDWKKWISVNLK